MNADDEHGWMYGKRKEDLQRVHDFSKDHSIDIELVGSHGRIDISIFIVPCCNIVSPVVSFCYGHSHFLFYDVITSVFLFLGSCDSKD